MSIIKELEKEKEAKNFNYVATNIEELIDCLEKFKKKAGGSANSLTWHGWDDETIILLIDDVQVGYIDNKKGE